MISNSDRCIAFGIFLISVVFSSAQHYGECTTANGESAFCIQLNQCPIIKKMITKRQLSDEEKSFLKRSQCGYKSGNILVCCPMEPSLVSSFFAVQVEQSEEIINYGNCTTPRGESASCIKLQQCPAINELIKKDSLSNEEKSYIKRSQCGYKNRNYLVCCPKVKITSYGSCFTPKGVRASCIKLNQCAPINNLLKKKFLPQEVKMNIKRSQCGYTNGTVLVCCPGTLSSAEANAVLPEPGTCGYVVTDRIFGGNITQIDEYNWMTLIEYSKDGKDVGNHCGGSLINIRYVLTSAHCILSIPSGWKPVRVRLGEWDTSIDNDCVEDEHGFKDCANPTLVINIDKAITHNNYDPLNKWNDIALLRLSESIVYTDYIRPICLPLNEKIRHTNFEGIIMDISGWGITEHGILSNKKLKAGIRILPLDVCKRFYRPYKIKIRRRQICADGAGGTDTCRGDSGGPLIGIDTTDNKRIYSFIYGIVSFGIDPCGRGPAVYTNVGNYTDWIIKTMKNNESHFEY